MWSTLAEQVVSRLIAERTADLPDFIRVDAERLSALPIGLSMWAAYFLRANGEVVVVGDDFDHPEVDTVHTERGQVVLALVWGSRRYPELTQLLPIRGPGAVDRQCRVIPCFAEGKVLCLECGGLGWLPAANS